MAKVDLGGVWRTVGGRRIFIKDGEDLETAMHESGKFLKKMSKEEKAEKSVELKNEREELRDKLYKRGKYKDSEDLSKEEQEKIKKRIEEITKEKTELDKDLTPDDLKEARHRIEEKNRNVKIINYEEEKNKVETLKKEYAKELDDEVEKKLQNIEEYEGEYGIKDNDIDYKEISIYNKISELYENNEISDYVYEQYLDEINKKVANYMESKGYEIYEHNGNIYYSMIPKAKKSYENILKELDKMGVNYEISKSWNPGELPSIYVKDDDGNQFRIANHFNSKNQQFKARSVEQNKIYSTKDYINYKETVFNDLKKFLKK